MFARAAERMPGASIEVVTRAELEEPFRLTAARRIHVVPGLARGDAGGADAACARLAADPRAGALAIDDPDPTRWIAGARRVPPPRLAWDARYDALAAPLVDPATAARGSPCIRSTETAQHYRFVKDWPAAHWRALLRGGRGAHRRPLRAGRPRAARPRSRRPTCSTCAAAPASSPCSRSIRTRCAALVAPDGGVLNAVYYLDADVSAARGVAVGRPAPGPDEARHALAQPGARAPCRSSAPARDVANVRPAQVLDALLPLPR